MINGPHNSITPPESPSTAIFFGTNHSCLKLTRTEYAREDYVHAGPPPSPKKKGSAFRQFVLCAVMSRVSLPTSTAEPSLIYIHSRAVTLQSIGSQQCTHIDRTRDEDTDNPYNRAVKRISVGVKAPSSHLETRCRFSCLIAVPMPVKRPTPRR